MEIRKVFELDGPNIWANSPVLEAWVDLGHFEELPTDKLPGFSDRLLQALPSLIEHRCSVGERGGFSKRLYDGTWLGHVLEHVTLELQSLTHAPVGWGRAREMPERGVYKVVVKCESTRFAEHCLRSARELILACVDARPFALAQELERLRVLADQLCLGPSTRAIVQAAKARGIPQLRLTDGNLMQLGYGSRQRRIWTAETDRTSAVAEGIAQDKELTRRLLTTAGVPVPAGRAVTSADDAWLAARALGEPVVVKPIDANHGRGVSIRVDQEPEVRAAFERAALEGSGVVVERFVPGSQHRVLVVGERAIAAARGEADEVVGDGQASIEQLVERENRDPRRGEVSAQLLSVLRLNEVALDLLRRQDFTPKSVLAPGQRALIQYHGDLTVDETDQLHPEVAACCVLAAQTVGLDIAGIDLVCADIGRPLGEQGGAVIEVNASPGLVAHLKPLVGQPRPVGEAIVARLFEAEQQGRVPIVAVSGTGERASVTQLVAQLLSEHGFTVARADSSGLYLGARRLTAEPACGRESARRALMNPSASAIVLEVSESSTLEQGLAFDRCQVAIVTSTARASELARPGIDEPVTVLKAIRAPVDVVAPGGCAIMCHDDPEANAMAEHCPGEVVLVGANDWARWSESPPPAGVERLLAAAAAALALGVPAPTISTFLNSFMV